MRVHQRDFNPKSYNLTVYELTNPLHCINFHALNTNFSEKSEVYVDVVCCVTSVLCTMTEGHCQMAQLGVLLKVMDKSLINS